MTNNFWERLTWIDRLPRPERGGTIGAIMMVSLWLCVVTPYGGSSDLVCSILPWKCSAKQHQEKRENKPRPRLLSLVFFGRPSKGKPLCACHYDIWLKSERSLHHIATGNHPYACDSAFYWPEGVAANDWKELVPNDLCWRGICRTTTKASYPVEPGRFVTIDLQLGDMLRNHCTEDPQYIREYGEVIETTNP